MMRVLVCSGMERAAGELLRAAETVPGVSPRCWAIVFSVTLSSLRRADFFRNGVMDRFSAHQLLHVKYIQNYVQNKVMFTNNPAVWLPLEGKNVGQIAPNRHKTADRSIPYDSIYLVSYRENLLAYFDRQSCVDLVRFVPHSCL